MPFKKSVLREAQHNLPVLFIHQIRPDAAFSTHIEAFFPVLQVVVFPGRLHVQVLKN
jgi:hypothetical protein